MHSIREQINLADRQALLGLLHPFLPPDSHLILFGSRARGDAGPYSDIDLAVRAPGPIDRGALADMRERVEQSNVPYRIDLVDYASAPAALREAIDRDGIEWTA